MQESLIRERNARVLNTKKERTSPKYKNETEESQVRERKAGVLNTKKERKSPKYD